MADLGNIPAEKRAAVATLGTHFIVMKLIAALVEQGVIAPDDVRKIADSSPEDDVGAFVRSALKPFLKLG